jgi:lipopolysaccharide biosynthesis glycosyltransferase
VKIAYVSTLTEDYVLGLKVFIKSILLNNPATNFDYVILEEEPISEKSKLELKELYNNFKFRNIKLPNYTNISFSGIRQWRINPANRLDIFTLSEYDKVIFFDVDMLCTGDISALHTSSGEFLACYHPMADVEQQMLGFVDGFNCGVMAISNKFINQNTIDAMIDIMRSKKWLGNQSTFNLYFKEIYKLLPSEYFLSTPFINTDNFTNAKIYHFAGEIKPWHNLDTRAVGSEYLEKKYCPYVLSRTDHILLHRLLVKYNNILKTVV